MRTLILILTRDAEGEAVELLSALGTRYGDDPETDILLIDDASADGTAGKARALLDERGWRNVTVLQNRHPQGHGGNQKVGCRYALLHGYDVVAILPAVRESNLGALAALVDRMRDDPQLDCVLGLATIRRSWWRDRRGRFQSALQSRLAGVSLRGWRAQYRVYRCQALERIAFELGTNDEHFDTEILLQLLDRNGRVLEVEIAATEGARRPAQARNALKATLKYRLQRYNLFYDVRYHPEVFRGASASAASVYAEKLGEDTPHSFVLSATDLVGPGARVIDLGCATGYVARALSTDRGCRVLGVDQLPPAAVRASSFEYRSLDLERDTELLNEALEGRPLDAVLMLDVLEHLLSPERTLLNLASRRFAAPPLCLFSTGNVAFFVIRIMLLLGFFNYGQKGILDVTHRRLFSLRTFRNLLEQTGFVIRRRVLFPVPFRALGFPPGVAATLARANRWLLRFFPSLFAYQVLFVATPLQRPEAVLEETLGRGASAESAESSAPAPAWS
jgi:2-polyprenyl-3-methyl-5-hydroxy-6-metoxy-1,4-benzoquinol methylase